MKRQRRSSLNAPYGAPCFLTYREFPWVDDSMCLNAPYGAPYFLTDPPVPGRVRGRDVLMHLMVLCAF